MVSNKIKLIKEIENLNTNQLVNILEKNGLGDCVFAIQERQIDGEEFMKLTEGKLIFWKKSLTNIQIKRLYSIIQVAQNNPEHFIVKHEQSQEIENDTQKKLVSQCNTQLKDTLNACLLKTIPQTNKIKKSNNEPIYVNLMDMNKTIATDIYPKRIVKIPVPENEQFQLPLPPKPTITQTPFNKTEISKTLPLPPSNIQTSQLSFLHTNNLPKPPLQKHETIKSVSSSPHTLTESPAPPLNNPDISKKPFTIPSSNHNIPKKPFMLPSHNPDIPKKPFTIPSSNPDIPKKPFTIPSSNPDIPKKSFTIPSSNPDIPKKPIMLPSLNHDLPKRLPVLPTGTKQQLQLPNKTENTSEEQKQKIISKSRLVTLSEIKSRPLPPIPKDEIPESNLKNASESKPPLKIPENNQNNSASGTIVNKKPLPTPLNEKQNVSLPRPPQLPILPINTKQLIEEQDDDFNSDYEDVINDIPEYRNEPWFQNMDRKSARQYLQNCQDGSFIVRPSNRENNICTLMIKAQEQIFNLAISRKNPGELSIGNSRSIKTTFGSVQEIIEHYSTNAKLILNGSQNEEILISLKKY